MHRLIKNRRGFTLIEVIVTMALFGMITMVVVTLLNTVLSSSTESQRKIVVSGNASTTKEVLIRTLEPSTELEILSDVVTNDLTAKVYEPVKDSEYSYLYTIDGDVYYRGPYDKDKYPSGVVVGEKIPMLSSTSVQLKFKANDVNPRNLDIDMEFATKEAKPYKLEESLLISPLNIPEINTIIDNRPDVEKSAPSNIIRFISSEIILTNIPQPSDDLQIVSIVANKANSGINDDVAFTVSQEPREVALVYDTRYSNSLPITSADNIDSEGNPVDPVGYYQNTIIRQSKYMSTLTTARTLTITYKGQYFIDARGIVKEGVSNTDGTKTLTYALPVDQYDTTEELHFAVTSKKGEYLEYDWDVIRSLPEPQIVSFEFKKEDNSVLQDNQNKLMPHDVKTYINQNDVYYADNALNTGNSHIAGTSPNEVGPEKFPSITNPNTLDSGTSFYSTIVLPLNQKNDKDKFDYYPSLNDAVNTNGTNYLTTKVATVTFKGTELYDPTGKSIPIPPSERSKLNGVSEVKVKISVDTDMLGNVYYLDGEELEHLIGVTDQNVLSQYNAYTNGNNRTWFDAKTQPIFTVSTLSKTNTKRYVFQKEYGTSTPDYHEGTNVDAGLTKVWVNDYLDGAWVGGSMRGRVADNVEISYPYDKMSDLSSDIKIKAAAYGQYLVYLPAYINGAFDTVGGGAGSTDDVGYYELDPSETNIVKLLDNKDVRVGDSSLNIAYPKTNNDANSLKHLLVLQSVDVYNAVTPYTIKIVPEYPANIKKPEIINIRANEIVDINTGLWNVNTTQDTNIQRNYFKGDNTFSTNNSLNAKYNGNYINLDVTFAGSKFVVSTSMDPKNIGAELLSSENQLLNPNSAIYNKENPLAGREFAYMSTIRIPYTNEYYIHLYDYDGKVCNTYRILQNTSPDNTIGPKTRMRSTVIYQLESELKKHIATGINNKTNIYLRPFVPIKTSLAGASYGYDLNLPLTNSILSGNISGLNGSFTLKKFPFFFKDDTYFNGETHYNYFTSHAGGDDIVPYEYTYSEIVRDDYITTNFRNYNAYNATGPYVNKYRIFIKSTMARYFNSYSLGGNNLSTMPVFNVSTMMTPIRHDQTLNSVGAYDTDRYMGDTDRSNTRKNMKASNVKFDRTGFQVHIQTDRPIDAINTKNPASPSAALLGNGRPGTIAMTSFDVAFVDKKEFFTDYGMNTVTYGPVKTNQENKTLYSSAIRFNNKPVYTNTSEMTNNDVVGFGFALVENNVDRDLTQNYLGSDPTGVSRKSDTEREVSLMFYTRQFFFEDENNKDKVKRSLPKSPATFVKICDVKAFNTSSMTNYLQEFAMNTQGVNFNVDVKTTYDGTTIVNNSNYDDIMNNNYIEFTVVEMDYAGKGNLNVDYQRFSFADVFGGIRVDDGYKELNLLLNQLPRVSGEKVYLSTGYNTNFGTVGISDFTILK